MLRRDETSRMIVNLRDSRFASGTLARQGMELLIALKVFPSLGPSKRTTEITIIKTNERIIAYSTSPCPFSSNENNIMDSPLRTSWY